MAKNVQNRLTVYLSNHQQKNMKEMKGMFCKVLGTISVRKEIQKRIAL